MFPILAGSNPSGYNFTRSLRTRASASAYLNRTFGTPTNNKIWTLSFWVKRGDLVATSQYLLHTSLIGLSAAAYIYFSNNTISYWDGSLLRASTQVFRDPSSWYHIIVAFDSTQATANNRVKMYINGVEITAFTTLVNPSLNYNSYINSATAHYISSTSPSAFDGYLAEVNFIDGQQLTPSSFGSTNTLTGVWQPAPYTGSYGTNGFILDFEDNSALTTSSNVGLGKDTSGNANYWVTNNISITAGVTYDSMTDVPTLTSATAANFAVLNPISTNTVGVATLTNGNLTFSVPNTFTAIGSMSATSGKYYWEAIATSNPVGVGLKQLNVLDRYSNTIYYMGSSLSATGEKYVNGTGSAYGASWTTGDVIGVAVDMDGGTVTFYKNNASQGSIALSTASITAFVPSFVSGAGVTFAGNINFGQQPFTYTPPTGFVALNTYNLPTSTILQGNTVMDATLYTGNGGTQAVVNAAGFKPDFVWLKSRSAAYDHLLFDSIRGTGKALFSSSTAAETTTNNMSAFNSNGFTALYDATYIGSNNSGVTMVGWQWQAGQGTTSSNTNGTITSTVSVNASAGFSVATFTANGTAGATIGHGLGVAPSLIFVKSRSNSGTDWIVYHSSLGATQGIYLSLTNAAATSSAFWNNTAPTSSVFSIGSTSNVNVNGYTNVAYCWTPIAGFSAFGSYTGNGSTDGPMVYTGFRPAVIMVKRTDTTGNWCMFDDKRLGYNGTSASKELYPNLSNAEGTSNGPDQLSNGFKLRDTYADVNASGGTYVYACWAENPFKNSLAR